LYTDGIIETSKKSGELFGLERLESTIRESSSQPAESSADFLLDHLAQWSGKSGSTSLDDDLTLIIIEMAIGF
jgi:serine phosphatase RsbU (regulator of sigma subunit)